MRKTLIYHLYMSNDFESNIMYKIHYKCLKYFAYVFDDFKFTISLNDLSDKLLINKAYNLISDICEDKPFEFKIIKNDEFREAKTFYDNVYNNINDDIVFFAHSKGLSNIYNERFRKESIIKWVIVMYFYNLYFFDKNVNTLIDGNQCFNGTLLMVPEIETFNRKQHYAGTFYWVNLKKIINYKKIGVIQNIELDNRYLAENFPGMFFKRDTYSSGLHSLDDKAFINEVYGLDLLFIGDDNHWNNIINILGYTEEFWDFYNKIINNL